MKLDLIPTGEIVNTHGLRGHVKVMPWADAPEVLLEFDRFFIDGRQFDVEKAAVQKSMVLLKLAGVDDVDAAAKLRGKELCLAREDVALEEGTVFIADLIGRPVLADGKQIGCITEVLTMPGNDVYVVKGEFEYMIPAVKEYVTIGEDCVTVTLIEGMRIDAD